MPRNSKKRAGRGLLVTFEGTEGAGKSTLIRKVQARLHAQGNKVDLTREPGGSPVAERIRELILREAMDPWTEVFLYEAARAEHLAETVRPALQTGAIVLCDRFTDSTLAYQAHARGLPWRRIDDLNQLATGRLQPDLTVWLDIDPALGLRRANAPNRFEAEGIRFQTRVRQGFLKAMREAPRRWLRLKITETTPPDELADAVVKEMNNRFPTISLRKVRRK